MNIPPHERRCLASRCGVGDAYLYQVLTGRKPASLELCIAIERESGRSITCEALRPDVDWAYLRGTVVTADPANTQPATPAPAGSDIATAAAGQGA